MIQIHYDKNMDPIIVPDKEAESLKELSNVTEEKLVAVQLEEKEAKLEFPKIDADGRVSIIILAWNQVKYTQICIESIKKYTNSDMYQLIIIDQGSNDNTFDYLKDHVDGENDILIHNLQNRGFSGGNNQGLKVAESEYVLFINNDIKVLKDYWLDVMIKGTEEADLIGAICQKVKPDYEKRRFEHIGTGKENEPWSYLEGWCLFAKRELFLQLYGFDMRFNPGYSEDADLSFRVKKIGLKIKAINLPIKHFGSKTEKDIIRSFGDVSKKNNQKLFAKWIGGDEVIEDKSETPKVHKIVKRKTAQKPSILLKRKGAKGDVLMITPIVRELKKKYPESFLVVETENPDIIAGNLHIDHMEPYIPKPGDYDIILTPRYEDNPGGNAIDVMAEQCGVKLESRKMDISLIADQIRWAKNKIDMSKRYVAFHTGRTWKSREWPIDRFKEVAMHFLAEGYDIIELGDRETLRMNVGNDCRGCSIKQTASLIKECIAFVGIDSVCANIAKAVNTPAFIIYGCVDPGTRNADAVEYPIWIDDLKCRGCRNRTSAEYVECQKPEVYCLTMVEPDMVIKTVETYIRENIVRRKKSLVAI